MTTLPQPVSCSGSSDGTLYLGQLSQPARELLNVYLTGRLAGKQASLAASLPVSVLNTIKPDNQTCRPVNNPLM